jgi:hypothetical protein
MPASNVKNIQEEYSSTATTSNLTDDVQLALEPESQVELPISNSLNDIESANSLQLTSATSTTTQSAFKFSKKRSSKVVTSVEKSMESIQKYFETKLEKCSKESTSVQIDDANAIFGKLVGSEIMRIENDDARATVKRYILNSIYDAIEFQHQQKQQLLQSSDNVLRTFMQTSSTPGVSTLSSKLLQSVQEKNPHSVQSLQLQQMLNMSQHNVISTLSGEQQQETTATPRFVLVNPDGTVQLVPH